MILDWIRYWAPLAEPLGLLWLLHLAGAVFLFKRKQRQGALFLAGLAGLIFLFTGTPLATRRLAALEQPYAGLDWARLPDADAVVALGGGHSVSAHDRFGFDLGQAADRLVTALELIRMHKGRALVLGGGTYADTAGREQENSRLLQPWLEAWQLPGVPVFNLGPSKNTQQEALALQALAKKQQWRRILLVTSAFHLRRAEAVFRRTGVTVIPVGCDFRACGVPDPGQDGRFPYSPRRERLEHLELFLHEQLGWLVYYVRGWTGG